ncbi:NAD-dependent epimerase/dehydratase family protein [Aurantiacibacter spongiae]|uniref:NAD(P)-dependent oxidoreductase n=1 Tax=Aurantiacibacter spongiae TaxID=2488860 RepID=A0A3N5CQ50_9SPHN|nr:NAD(P)-dependent oxidoreductase [Aurantiacibacter spongiae]RPF71163.1 NAD(P)-dependent oxidoreductase [Aurantiacibacter spongiae]
MRRVALTGGTGFVGRNLAAALREAGLDIRFLSRSEPDGLSGNDDYAPCDLTSDIDSAIFDGCDALLHLASHIPSNQSDPAAAEVCLTVNARGSLLLADAACRAGVRRLIHLTSGNAYDPSDYSLRRETHPLGPISRQYYLGSKVAQELYLAQFAMAHDLSVTALRPGAIYGAGRGGGLLNVWMESLMQGRGITVTNGGRYGADFVLVDDVVRAVMLTLQLGAEGTFNVGTGQRWELSGVALTAARVAGLGEDSITVLPAEGPPDPGFAPLDCSRLAALGFEATALADGLETMLPHYGS